MSIEGIHNSLGSMMSIRRQDALAQEGPEGTTDAVVTGEPNRLSRLTDNISLSSIDPRLRSALENISEQGGNVLEALEQNVGNLQEGLLQGLQSRFAENGVDMNEKITLKLSSTETLTVTGEHPDRETIENVLAKHPELEEAFKEIATQSQLTRDIRSIRQVVGSSSGIATYEGMQASVPVNQTEAYNVSMRGAMSHFYFSANTEKG